MMESVTAPSVPLVQMNVPGGPSNFLNSLASALNPQSAAALASVQPVPDAPVSTPEPPAATPPPAVESTAPEPALEKPTAAEETKTAEPLKKGLDALTDGVEEKKDAQSGEGDGDEVFPAEVDTPEKKSAWSGIQKEVRSLRKEKSAWETEKRALAEQASKAKQFTEADPEWKAYQAAKARLEEVEPVIARVAYTKTQAYRDSIEAPRNEIGVVAKQMAEQFKIPDNKMIQALTESDPVRQSELLDEISSEMDSRSKSRLFRMADDLDNLARLDERMAENAAAAAKEAEAIEAQRTQQSAIEKKAAEMRAIENSREKLAKAASLFTLENESAENAVASILNEANQTPFDEMDNDQKAFSIIAASLVPRMQRQIRSKDAEITKLREQIKGLAGATPRAGAAGQANGAGGDKPKSFMESLAEAQAGMQGMYGR